MWRASHLDLCRCLRDLSDMVKYFKSIDRNKKNIYNAIIGSCPPECTYLCADRKEPTGRIALPIEKTLNSEKSLVQRFFRIRAERRAFT